MSGSGWFEADQRLQIRVAGSDILRPVVLFPMASNHLSSLGFLQLQEQELKVLLPLAPVSASSPWIPVLRWPPPHQLLLSFGGLLLSVF